MTHTRTHITHTYKRGRDGNSLCIVGVSVTDIVLVVWFNQVSFSCISRNNHNRMKRRRDTKAKSRRPHEEDDECRLSGDDSSSSGSVEIRPISPPLLAPLLTKGGDVSGGVSFSFFFLCLKLPICDVTLFVTQKSYRPPTNLFQGHQLGETARPKELFSLRFRVLALAWLLRTASVPWARVRLLCWTSQRQRQHPTFFF